MDAYGGRRYPATSSQIAGATGATFSLLPPDNATGNFVKVVQRVPVKIVLDGAADASAVLRPGHVGQRDGLPAMTTVAAIGAAGPCRSPPMPGAGSSCSG